MFNGQYSPPPPNLEESLSMDIFSLAHTDYLNRFCWDIFGESTYESVDYRMDKQYETLQRASKGRGIDIILLGDAFTDIDIATGYYHNVMEFVMESFFSIEPTKTYRDYFNVHMVYAVSRRACVGDDPTQTALGTVWDKVNGVTNRLIQLPDYVYVPVSRGVIPYPSIIVNGKKTGFALVEGTGIIKPNYAFSCYLYGGLDYLKYLILHESVGHGFGLLGDEYIDYIGQELPESNKNRLKLDQAKGLCLNLSLTNDFQSVYWSHLIGHPRYPYVGVYEGGYKYDKGVWRSERVSLMSTLFTDLYFNAISRELLVKRILELSGEGYSFDKFLQKDSDEGRPTGGSLSLSPFRSTSIDWVDRLSVGPDEP